MNARCVLWVWLLGCAEPGPAVSTDAGSPPIEEAVRATLQLTGVSREGPDGRVRGVDLDGRVSDATDEQSCFQEDWTDSLTGVRGVDNQYYALHSVLDLPGALRPPGEPPADVVIEDAEITIAVELLPTLGGARVRLGESESPMVPIAEGHFQAFTDALLELRFAGVHYTLRDLAIGGRVSADGELTDLVIAGAIDVEEAIATVQAAEPEADPGVVRTRFEGVADLARGDDGRCRRFSAAFTAVALP